MTPQNDLSRRAFLAAGAALAFGLAACGDDDEGTTATAGESSTITVRTQFGTFEVPREPKRVIGWEGRRDFETALALGLRPVAIGSNAVYETDTLAPFIQGFTKEDARVITQTQPDLELIASLRPDLILTRDSNIEELVDQLKPLRVGLVPVKPDGPWRADLESVAGLLQRQEQTKKPLAAYDAKRDGVKEARAARIADATLAVVQFSENRFYASATDGFYLQANTLADLGGTHLPILEERRGYDDEGFSTERTGILKDADAILMIVNTEQERRDLEALKLWKRLPAVSADRVVFTDSRTNYGSVFAAGACVDLLDQTYAKLS